MAGPQLSLPVDVQAAVSPEHVEAQLARRQAEDVGDGERPDVGHVDPVDADAGRHQDRQVPLQRRLEYRQGQDLLHNFQLRVGVGWSLVLVLSEKSATKRQLWQS